MQGSQEDKMITTEQLTEWKERIRKNMLMALAGIDKYKSVPTMRDYYAHLAQTADAQLSMVQRLIIQSGENDESKTN